MQNITIKYHNKQGIIRSLDAKIKNNSRIYLVPNVCKDLFIDSSKS
jgi:hypothetical protein